MCIFYFVVELFTIECSSFVEEIVDASFVTLEAIAKEETCIRPITIHVELSLYAKEDVV